MKTKIENKINEIRKPEKVNNHFQDFFSNIGNKVSSIIDGETDDYGLRNELRLAKEFGLDESQKNKLERDYKEPLTVAKVMSQAENFFNQIKENTMQTKLRAATVLDEGMDFWKEEAADDYKLQKIA